MQDQQRSKEPLPVLDHARLRLSCGGDAEFEQEVVAVFLRTASETLSRLSLAVASGDDGAVESEAHALKGSCRTVGAVALGRVCEALELSGKEGALTGAEALLARAESEFERLQAVLVVAGEPLKKAA